MGAKIIRCHAGERMKQASLFDPPISRRSDPETSHLAEIQHTLTKRAERQRQVLNMVEKYPHNTSGEYSRIMLKLYPDLPVRTAVESPHKRLRDLETKGLVTKSGRRMCRDSHYLCNIYAITWHGRASLK